MSIMEHRSIGVVEYWSAGVLECWSAGVLECWGAGVLECWSAVVLECWGAGGLEWWFASAGVVGGMGEMGAIFADRMRPSCDWMFRIFRQSEMKNSRALMKPKIIKTK